MAEKLFEAQSNYGWGLSLNMTGKAPAVAKRIWNTYADALAFVNDFNETAIEGIRLSVVNDSDPKKNGVYYVVKAGTYTEVDGVKTAKNDGELKKIGGAETEVVAKYSDAVTLSNNLVVGQLIKVTGEETIGEGENAQKYKAGFYIVVNPGSISALDTSTGSTDEIGALQTRVTALEGDRVKVADFNNYKLEVTGALDAKAGLTEFNTHNTNVNIHVTADDKAKWNNAQANAEATAANALAAAKTELQGYADQAELDAVAAAKTYADGVAGVYAAEGVNASGLRKEIAERDAAVLSEAKTYAKDYADGLAGNYDAKGSAETALGDAKDYTDAEIAKLDTAYKAADKTIGERIDGVETAYKAADEALGKKVDDMDAAYKAADAAIKTAYEAYADQAELDAVAAAKTYTDEREATIKTAYEAYADQAEADAKSYTDTVVGVYASEGVEATGLRKEIAEKVAAVAADAKSYSVVAVTGDELAALGENIKEAYKLVDEDSVKAGEYIKIYKDSALQKVELNGQELEFTYLLTDGKSEVVKVDVSNFLAESEFGDGLQVIDHVVSVKVAEGSESFLSVSADGIKLAGIQTAIDAAEEAAKDYTDAEIATAVGVYASEGVEATGLRAEIAGAFAAAQTAAEKYTDAEIAKVNEVIAENERVNAEALTDLDTRVTTNNDAIAVINGEGAGSIKKAAEDAKEAAIAKAAEDAAKMLENYYTKSEVYTKDEVDEAVATVADNLAALEDNLKSAAYKTVEELEATMDDKDAVVTAAVATVADDLAALVEVVGVAGSETEEATGIFKVIEDNERTTAEALIDLDDRIKANVQTIADVDVAAQGYASTAETNAEAYAKTYTDALFTSFQFATKADIDSLF